MKFFNGELTYSTSYLKDSGFRTVSGESIMPRRDDDDDDYGVFMKGGGDGRTDGRPSSHLKSGAEGMSEDDENATVAVTSFRYCPVAPSFSLSLSASPTSHVERKKRGGGVMEKRKEILILLEAERPTHT